MLRKFLVIPLFPVALVGAAVMMTGGAMLGFVLRVGLTKKERVDMRVNRLVKELAALSEG